MFGTLGKAGGCDSAQLEAISRLVSLALRSGIDPKNVIEQLRGITCCPAWDSGTLVRSSPDAVALAIERSLGDNSPGGESAKQPEGAIQMELINRTGSNGNGNGIMPARKCPDCNNRFSDWPGDSCPWCLRGMEITELRKLLRRVGFTYTITYDGADGRARQWGHCNFCGGKTTVDGGHKIPSIEHAPNCELYKAVGQEGV